MSGSRKSLFEELDRPALNPLPVEPYVYAEWKKARPHVDYHIEVDGFYILFLTSWSKKNWMSG